MEVDSKKEHIEKALKKALNSQNFNDFLDMTIPLISAYNHCLGLIAISSIIIIPSTSPLPSFLLFLGQEPKAIIPISIFLRISMSLTYPSIIIPDHPFSEAMEAIISPNSATLFDFFPDTTRTPPSLFSDNFSFTRELSSKHSTVEICPKNEVTAP